MKEMESPDVVFVLGGGLMKENGAWRTTRFDEGDTHGALGDSLRVAAAAALFHKEPSARIIAIGGKGQYAKVPDAPPVSRVIKDELVSLGVPGGIIETEESSGTTWQQLRAVKRFIAGLPPTGLCIVSNRYHIPRVKAMAEADWELLRLLETGTLTLVSAEEVLLDHDRIAWEETINTAYKTDAMRRRIQLEEEGVRQIHEGTYHFE